MNYIIVILTFLLGCLIPFQALFNAKVGKATGHALFGSLTNFIGGIVILGVAFYLLQLPISNFSQMKNINMMYWLGGLVGASFVTAGIFFVPKIGPAAFFIFLLAGQMVMSLIIDHYGILLEKPNEVSINKLIGVGFVMLGAYFVNR